MQSTVSDSYSVGTLVGSGLNLTSLLPIDFVEQRDFTLNNDLNIFPNEPITTRPKLRYYGVGIRGAYNADDGILSSAYNPSKLNMGLYTPIPLRCVPVDEDLTDADRAQYRLRQRKTIKGQEYFLYYLKALEFLSGVKYKRVNADGTEEPYELDPSYLHPEPIKMSTDATLITNNATIVAYCEARVSVYADEVLEYIRAAFDGDTRYAKISEMGFFTGVDKEVSGSTGQNVPITYTEAIYTMLQTHMTNVGFPLTHSGMSYSSNFEITSEGAITQK